MRSLTDTPSRLLTTHDVANILGLSVRQVRRMYGELGAFRVTAGRGVRFDPERLGAWIAERQAEAHREAGE